MNRYRQLIEGGVHHSDASVVAVENPATQETVASVTCATSGDLEAAVAAATSGLRRWSEVAPTERGRILASTAARLESELERHARTLTLETGKTLTEARGEWQRTIETLRWFSIVSNDVVRPRSVSMHGVRRTIEPEPIGVAALFTPWNYPAVVAARKIGSALVAGCSAIVKGSEEAPGSVVAIAEALYESGLPRNVLSVVFGVPVEVSRFLLRRKEVAVLSFTGSTFVGRLLARDAAETLKRCILELGGHCPVIVCDDADVDETAKAVAAYKFEHAGQSCNAPSRIYVAQRFYESFVRTFVEFAERLVVGNGLHLGTTMGPVASCRRLKAVEDIVEDALSQGAFLATGGRRIGTGGYFYAPTVLERVPRSARMLQEEPFGPIVAVEPFADLDDAIARANDTPYGLAAYVFSGSMRTAADVARRLHSGSAGINGLSGVPPDAPVGGVGDSGYGYEGGRRGIEAFLNLKLVSDASAFAAASAVQDAD